MSGVVPGLWEQGCQPEGLPCALILPGPLPWQKRAPGKTTRRNQWGFSGKATYFLAGSMPRQQGSLPMDPLRACITQTQAWETGDKKGFRK